MTIFNGTLVGGTASADLNSRTYLSSNLQVADANIFDPYSGAIRDPVSGAYAHVLFPAHINTFPSGDGGSSNTVFYKGIHFTVFEELYDGSNYSAGVITDTVAFPVNVQQMSKHSKVVESISVTTGQGVGISGISTGDIFNPYEEKTLTVTLDKEGVASINATLSIKLVGDSNTYFTVLVGFRFQLPIMLQASWEEGLTIKRAFQTSVFNSFGTGESRKVLRKNPIRTLTADLTFLSETASTQAWQVLRSRAKGPNVIPFYPDAGEMTQANDTHKFYLDTTYFRYSAGGIVIAIKYASDNSVIYYDVHRILSVDVDGVNTETEVANSYTPRDTVCPGMACYPSFGSDVKSNITRSLGTISIEAEEIYGPTAIALENSSFAPTICNSLPIFDYDINEVDPMDIETSFQGDITSSGRGRMWYLQGDNTRTSLGVLVTAISREEYWDLLGFFNYMKGRGRAFWMREYSKVLPIIAEGAGFITVFGLDLSDWEEIRYLWLEDASGVSDVVDVTSVTEVVDGFRITHTSTAITPSRYHQALKVRLDSDEIEEKWFTNTVVDISFQVTELQGA